MIFGSLLLILSGQLQASDDKPNDIGIFTHGFKFGCVVPATLDDALDKWNQNEPIALYIDGTRLEMRKVQSDDDSLPVKKGPELIHVLKRAVKALEINKTQKENKEGSLKVGQLGSQTSEISKKEDAQIAQSKNTDDKKQ